MSTESSRNSFSHRPLGNYVQSDTFIKKERIDTTDILVLQNQAENIRKLQQCYIPFLIQLVLVYLIVQSRKLLLWLSITIKWYIFRYYQGRLVKSTKYRSLGTFQRSLQKLNYISYFPVSVVARLISKHHHKLTSMTQKMFIFRGGFHQLLLIERRYSNNDLHCFRR